MPSCRVGARNSSTSKIRHGDHGSGRPIVLVHDPLDGNSWERQERALVDAGYRTIEYDRRGFGESSLPTIDHDYDTFAADLDRLIDQLKLEDVILVGFSNWAGEVTRYLADYGSDRVRKAALLGAIPPFLRRTEESPARFDGRVLEDVMMAALKDRFAHLKDFVDDFGDLDVQVPEATGEQAWEDGFDGLAVAPPSGYECIDTWASDFYEPPTIDVPILVVHGSEDRILPIASTSDRLPDLARDMRLVRVDGGPHNIGWTHSDQVNSALLEFLKEPVGAAQPSIAA